MKAKRKNQQTILNKLFAIRNSDDTEVLKVLGIHASYSLSEIFYFTETELCNLDCTCGQIAKIKALKTINDRFFIRTKELGVEIRSSIHAVNYIKPYTQYKKHEVSFVLYLSRANRVIFLEEHSRGGWNSTICEIKEVCKNALLLNAVGVILFHNHPSSNLKPGEYDTKVTADLKKALAVFGMNLLDHIIVSDDNYCSLADEIGI